MALGDGIRLLWDHNSEQIFRNNPNLIFPGEPLKVPGIEWVPFYKGRRIYNRQEGNRWLWNDEFHVTPGEFYFSAAEQEVARKLSLPRGYIVVEPNTNKGLHPHAAFLINKQWAYRRFGEVACLLLDAGHRVVQFIHGNGYRIPGAILIQTPTFRSAAAILQNASLYIGVEGGMHHAAAAVGVPAVVIFGGWASPHVLGYDNHINLTGGETRFCGLLEPCAHCAAAMERISVDEVYQATQSLLRG